MSICPLSNYCTTYYCIPNTGVSISQTPRVHRMVYTQSDDNLEIIAVLRCLMRFEITLALLVILMYSWALILMFYQFDD